ncbi:MAG: hypothetical protein HOI21_13085 [Bacteroidetes Order II. Incertae sedis bacterium]|nr:hypothetical protein [Bacteroidetes Order II. bacterium]
MPIRATGLAFVVGGVALIYTKIPNWRRELGAGLLVLISAFINVESAAAVLVGLVGVAIVRQKITWRLGGSFAFLVTPSFLAVLGLAFVQNRTNSICNLDCTVEFIRLFGAIGFYSVDMPITGPHLVLFIGFTLSAIIAARTLAALPLTQGLLPLGRIAALTVGVSFYGLATASYYVNRSYAALLLVLFPSFALAASGLLSLLRPWERRERSDRLRVIAPMAIALLPLTFLLHQATPGGEWSRLTGNLPESVAPFVAEIESMEAGFLEIAAVYEVTSDKIGIASAHLMPLAIRYEVAPALAYNSMGDSILTLAQMDRQCKWFEQTDLEIIVVYPQGLHEIIEPALACGPFVFDRVFDPALVVYRKPLAPNPIDLELDDLATASFTAGFFAQITGQTLVIYDWNSWQDLGTLYLEKPLGSSDIRILNAIPQDTVSCGVAAICDSQGRRLFILQIVDRGTAKLLLFAPIAGVGESLDQTVVMVNTSTMFGWSNNLPICDIGGADLAATIDTSPWDTRVCSPVVPTQITGFVSWMTDGCTGRSGWWLCP